MRNTDSKLCHRYHHNILTKIQEPAGKQAMGPWVAAWRIFPMRVSMAWARATLGRRPGERRGGGTSRTSSQSSSLQGKGSETEGVRCTTWCSSRARVSRVGGHGYVEAGDSLEMGDNVNEVVQEERLVVGWGRHVQHSVGVRYL